MGKEIDINESWAMIRKHFRKCFHSSLHVSIASIDTENHPTSTPIGSLFLNDDQTGFYFEKYPTKLRTLSPSNKSVCVLAVDSSKLFWLKSLFAGKFHSYPAIKLYGELGERRSPSELELRALKRRMRSTKRLKGHKYLWEKMDAVREISFTRAEKINLGKMTRHL
jgi:hypothetical protein